MSDEIAVGVPDKTPVDVSKLNPVGSAGDTDQLETEPPAFVGLKLVIALPTVRFKDDDV